MIQFLTQRACRLQRVKCHGQPHLPSACTWQTYSDFRILPHASNDQTPSRHWTVIPTADFTPRHTAGLSSTAARTGPGAGKRGHTRLSCTEACTRSSPPYHEAQRAATMVPACSSSRTPEGGAAETGTASPLRLIGPDPPDPSGPDSATPGCWPPTPRTAKRQCAV